MRYISDANIGESVVNSTNERRMIDDKGAEIK
jgi:hypothetical protein